MIEAVPAVARCPSRSVRDRACRRPLRYRALRERRRLFALARRIWSIASNSAALEVCVRSPVWIRKSGAGEAALILSTAFCSVPVTSGFAGFVEADMAVADLNKTEVLGALFWKGRRQKSGHRNSPAQSSRPASARPRHTVQKTRRSIPSRRKAMSAETRGVPLRLCIPACVAHKHLLVECS